MKEAVVEGKTSLKALATKEGPADDRSWTAEQPRAGS